MQLKRILIDDIEIGVRHRREIGELKPLVDSLSAIGLLQPIGISQRNKLIFGERRLKAALKLGWKEIDCNVINLESIVGGEFAENELRKDFTPSERIAIAKAVEQELGNRKGRPDKTNPPDRAELKGKETRDVAAKKAGFSSKNQYRRAASVVEMGAPETVAAMDSGELAIEAAAVVAKLPKQQQAEVVAMPKEKRRGAVRDARAAQEKARFDQETVSVRTFGRWIEEIGNFTMRPEEFWDALGRHPIVNFPFLLDRATTCLRRVKESQPNEAHRSRALR